jgi:hypothetical protein
VSSVDIILADFLGYIKNCIQEFITTSYGDGPLIWTTLYPQMDLILTTPNGWEGAQQQRMRTAAHKAGFVGQNGGQRVHFVTEAEVRLLYHLAILRRETDGLNVGRISVCR